MKTYKIHYTDERGTNEIVEVRATNCFEAYKKVLGLFEIGIDDTLDFEVEFVD